MCFHPSKYSGEESEPSDEDSGDDRDYQQSEDYRTDEVDLVTKLEMMILSVTVSFSCFKICNCAMVLARWRIVVCLLATCSVVASAPVQPPSAQFAKPSQ